MISSRKRHIPIHPVMKQNTFNLTSTTKIRLWSLKTNLLKFFLPYIQFIVIIFVMAYYESMKNIPELLVVVWTGICMELDPIQVLYVQKDRFLNSRHLGPIYIQAASCSCSNLKKNIILLNAKNVNLILKLRKVTLNSRTSR